MKRLLVTAALTAALAFGSSTAAWEMNTYQDFIKGRFTGLSLSRDGKIVLSPRLETIFSSDQPSIWSIAQRQDGTLYVGTGHRGRIYRIDSSGKSAVLWTAPQPEIFAVAVGPDGAVYAGTSPSGKVYRIDAAGKATEYFAPGAKYIWALSFGADGALYVGTGDEGKIFRVVNGMGEVYYDTGQAHVTCFAFDGKGQLFAGSEPNGILYRITAKDKAFALYDASLPEIRTIAVAPDGVIYAVAMGGSVQQRTNAATTAGSPGAPGAVTAPTTSITVTDEAQAGIELKPKADAAKTQQQAAATSAVGSYSPILDMTGVEKSAVYKIHPDHTVETVWTSKEENAYDLLLADNQVFFSTDAQGRIYRLGPDKHVTLMAQTNEGETTRLLASGSSVVAATGSMGKLYRMLSEANGQGAYESPVHDAGSVARWGQLSWRGEVRSGAKVEFRTRSGNSARPDKTWSDWSAPVLDPKGSPVASPNARFVQWRSDFTGSGANSPLVSGVTLAYLPQNNPPVVRSINVTTQIGVPATGTKPAAAAAASSSTYSITVTDTGEAGPATAAGTPTQTAARTLTQQILISWQAEDEDGDRLVYSLYFRGEDEQQWKLLRGNFADSSLLLEGDVFADGKYHFRILASDSPSNAGPAARQSQLVSAPVLFDNTPPVLRAGLPRRTGTAVEVEVDAADGASGLRRAEYSLDAGAWAPLDPVDGIIDGREEKFRIRIENLTPGEHLIVVRAFDSSNNAGLTKVVTP